MDSPWQFIQFPSPDTTLGRDDKAILKLYFFFARCVWCNESWNYFTSFTNSILKKKYKNCKKKALILFWNLAFRGILDLSYKIRNGFGSDKNLFSGSYYQKKLYMEIRNLSLEILICFLVDSTEKNKAYFTWGKPQKFPPLMPLSP